jgi:hypothetical protein
MDPRLQGLFTSLGATFEAEIARDEDVAADDLAFSLRQGRSLADVIERGSWDLLTPSGPRTLAIVAGDYVAAGSSPVFITPLAGATFVAGSAHITPAMLSDRTLLQLLRRLSRGGFDVELETASGQFRGRLLWAGTDHVVIDGIRGQVALGLDALQWIRVAELPADE